MTSETRQALKNCIAKTEAKIKAIEITEDMDSIDRLSELAKQSAYYEVVGILYGELTKD